MTKIAYLDCASGISGDMTLAALVDAGVRARRHQRGLGSLGLPGLRLGPPRSRSTAFGPPRSPSNPSRSTPTGICSQILAMIDAGQLTAPAEGPCPAHLHPLAEAEARVHGAAIEEVHFHEVGAADSIADIVGAAVGWDLLGVDRRRGLAGADRHRARSRSRTASAAFPPPPRPNCCAAFRWPPRPSKAK